MTSRTTTAASAMQSKETTAGGYFVSNYPPFNSWSRDNVPTILETLDRPGNPETPLGLYLHIPFCRKRCHFCYYKVYTDKTNSEIRSYIQGMTREMELYAPKKVLEGRHLQYVYFGGGTPSFLSPHQLTDLVRTLKSTLHWDRVEEVTFECEPGTLTEAKLEAIREIGVTRLSLGIENYDDHILEINGRAHRSPEIRRAYDFARSIGFPQINIDLIAGMIGETDRNWTDCVQRTLDLEPDSITVYQMEIPFNTTIYKEMREKGQTTAPVADWETKRRWVDEAFSALEERGYTVASAYTAVKDPDTARFIYRDSLWSGADMLALGVSSFGLFSGVHYQNEKDDGPYLGRIGDGELPIHRAHAMTEEEKLVRETILNFKKGRLDRGYFLKKFNVDIFERFERNFAGIQNEGNLQMGENEAVLTRNGLLRVDEYLHSFFLDEHRPTDKTR